MKLRSFIVIRFFVFHISFHLISPFPFWEIFKNIMGNLDRAWINFIIAFTFIIIWYGILKSIGFFISFRFLFVSKKKFRMRFTQFVIWKAFLYISLHLLWIFSLRTLKQSNSHGKNNIYMNILFCYEYNSKFRQIERFVLKLT